jgi:hypothetical protein
MDYKQSAIFHAYLALSAVSSFFLQVVLWSPLTIISLLSPQPSTQTCVTTFLFKHVVYHSNVIPQTFQLTLNACNITLLNLEGYAPSTF